MQDDIVKQAVLFATQAHARINHRRKYSLHPYDVHLRDVAQILASVTDDPEMSQRITIQFPPSDLAKCNI